MSVIHMTQYLLSFLLFHIHFTSSRHKLDLQHYHRWHDGYIDGAGNPCRPLVWVIMLIDQLSFAFLCTAVSYSYKYFTLQMTFCMFYSIISTLIKQKRQYDQNCIWRKKMKSRQTISNVLNFYFMDIGIAMIFFFILCTVCKTELASHH